MYNTFKVTILYKSYTHRFMTHSADRLKNVLSSEPKPAYTRDSNLAISPTKLYYF